MTPARTWKLALAGVALFVAGIGVAYVALRPGSGTPSPEHEAMPAQPAASAPAVSGAVIVELPTDVAARAGLVETEVRTQAIGGTTRIPGTVQPDAYRVVDVTTPASGRVLRVTVQLGDRVTAGTPVAVIQSPDLAKATTDQAAAAAALTAIERDLARTRKLVEIGAASRQELEAKEAEAADARARVDRARAEVRLLGGSGARGGEMTVRAPSSGVVTARAANPGLVVSAGSSIVTIASLSPVWVIADLAEADLGRVTVGDQVSIRAGAYPGISFAGRLTYIAPEVRPETRSAQIRVEVPNEAGRLRFGMLVEAQVETRAGGGTLVVPSSAIQRVGSRTVVYVPASGSRTRFEERTVEIGTERDGMVQVVSGLRLGERVVSQGSFLLRAEADRQGVRPAEPSAAPAPARVVDISVDATGFTPSRVTLRRGEAVVLRFTRVAESCATEVVVPEMKLRRALPLRQAVDISFTAQRSGEFAFVCGMDMLRGAIVVQ